MATRTVHQLSSSDEDSEDSFPDLGVRVKSLKRRESGERLEPEAVDLTLSSDTEDVVEMLDEQPEEYLSTPMCKAPRLSEEEPLAASYLIEEEPSAAPCLIEEEPLEASYLIEEEPPTAPCLSDEDPFDAPCLSDEGPLVAPCLSDKEPQLHKVNLPQSSGSQQAVKKPRKATSKEEREAARQRREEKNQWQEEAKQRRAAEKHQRALEKEAAKARREENKCMSRAQKPGECLKLLVVELERRLVEAREGGLVLSQLQEAGVSCRVVDGPVAASVTFFRANPLSGKESQADEAALVVMRIEDFVSAVGKQMHGWDGEAGLCDLCRQWQATLGTPHLSLVVCGVEEYFRKQKNAKQQHVRSAVLGARQHGGSSFQHINRVDMETALVMAQMEFRVNHRLLSDGGKVALYVLQVAKAVAEAPYKREKSEALFSWYAEGSSTNSVKVDKNGVGLYKLWLQQLRQFTHVGVEMAQAVASRYPSPQALVQAYRQCGSQREAELLLADLRVRRGVGPLASEKRVGPEFSRKIHLFLTSRDPDAHLANT
ncbi:crossover junction endonuclease EME1-like [Scylla paramamosain]|uniref:crossover junction endonuclease EME1-like n=1 Tax=Scylla paramamosain TaxID=85552 RepID=UPI003083B528